MQPNNERTVMISEMFNAIKECFLVMVQISKELLPIVFAVLTAAFAGATIRRWKH